MRFLLEKNLHTSPPECFENNRNLFMPARMLRVWRSPYRRQQFNVLKKHHWIIDRFSIISKR